MLQIETRPPATSTTGMKTQTTISSRSKCAARRQWRNRWAVACVGASCGILCRSSSVQEIFLLTRPCLCTMTPILHRQDYRLHDDKRDPCYFFAGDTYERLMRGEITLRKGKMTQSCHQGKCANFAGIFPSPHY